MAALHSGPDRLRGRAVLMLGHLVNLLPAVLATLLQRRLPDGPLIRHMPSANPKPET